MQNTSQVAPKQLLNTPNSPRNTKTKNMIRYNIDRVKKESEIFDKQKENEKGVFKAHYDTWCLLGYCVSWSHVLY